MPTPVQNGTPTTHQKRHHGHAHTHEHARNPTDSIHASVFSIHFNSTLYSKTSLLKFIAYTTDIDENYSCLNFGLYTLVISIVCAAASQAEIGSVLVRRLTLIFYKCQQWIELRYMAVYAVYGRRPCFSLTPRCPCPSWG